MDTLETPQSFVVREECQKAASQNGYRRVMGEDAGWACFASTTAQGAIYLAAFGSHGLWFLALEHAGIIEELGLPTTNMPGESKIVWAPSQSRSIFSQISRPRLCNPKWAAFLCLIPRWCDQKHNNMWVHGV